MPILRTSSLVLLTLFVTFPMRLANADDRVPAVAGQFYPAPATELRETLKQLFTQARKPSGTDDIRALIVPHAGYVFSGLVAASGFLQIDPGRDVANVFLIGVSHNAAYAGAAVYIAGDFLTPLGRVTVNKDIGRQLLAQRGLFLEHNRAHEAEHSLEVQLPFLQYHLKKPFRLVPILLGTADPGVCKRIAEGLRQYFAGDNLFVISTDLSHYPAYDDAVSVDKKTIDAVLSRSTDALLRTVVENERSGTRGLATSMCGLGGVLLLQELIGNDAQKQFSLIQYRNSGDIEAGEKERVVGYAAIAVKQLPKHSFSIRPTEKRELLTIARSTLEEYLNNGKIPDLRLETMSPALRTPCGAFVTLKKQGNLRGCIGNFSGTDPLAKTVQTMAIAAATEDHRFPPVPKHELKNLDIEISVLSPMRKVASAQEIELGKHGIYIRKGNHAGTFLPQVAQETGWSLEEFLGHCAQDKAGIGWDGWRDADVYVYEAIVFGERNHDTGR